MSWRRCKRALFLRRSTSANYFNKMFEFNWLNYAAADCGRRGRVLVFVNTWCKVFRLSSETKILPRHPEDRGGRGRLLATHRRRLFAWLLLRRQQAVRWSRTVRNCGTMPVLSPVHGASRAARPKGRLTLRRMVIKIIYRRNTNIK